MPTKIMTRLLAGTAISALLTGVSFAAEARPYDIPQQDAATALQAFAMQSGKQVLFPYEAVKGKQAPQIKGDYSDAEVIALLAGSAGLRVTADDGKTVTLRPQSAAAEGEGGADQGTVQALVVTAQKREENIQDVPIAMSAFTQEDLTKSQVTGGPDLMTQVPNFTFTKTNFSGYSIQIRGIGTQAISATTDAAVAVAFNNTPFIRNRFFEQEFYDLQRVEVLRGPQGTLYGRNATAGVVNIISAKPKFTYEARTSLDIGNYKSHRLEGMINVPLVEDKVAVRLAGAWTKRNGYDTNQITGSQIDGRDLWSTRLSLRFAPTDRLEANLIWEHFNEDDDRLRSGKQLCHTHEVTEVAGFPTTHYQGFPGSVQQAFSGIQGTFSQGCAPASLYAPESFETPNGISLPYYLPLGSDFLPIALTDPYASRTQSRDLRTIESTVNPRYRARTDTVELQAHFDLNDHLTLASETAFSRDSLFSLEDFNRFNTAPGAWNQTYWDFLRDGPFNNVTRDGLLEGGILCDPQIGCSDRLVAMDMSTAKSRQFSQEFRLSSDFEGPLNFSAGANFLRYDTVDKYYVFVNSLTFVAAMPSSGLYHRPPYVVGVTDNSDCLTNGQVPGDPSAVYPIYSCTYIDPNPVDHLNDLGHNYFLSKNPYKLMSYALFGEVYYQLREDLKITAGLRWTVDKKEAPRIPSWLLAADTVGYPVADTVRQEWREPTGRLTLDWKPVLSFADQTLVYASYAHGYKAGGANPPSYVYVFRTAPNTARTGSQQSAAHPKTFAPEYVNAFEVGSKNTLLDGKLTLNADAFYYDYKGYQISQIVDRAALNLNFDSTVWGAELEAEWRPRENLRLGLKAGYESTRLANGSKAIDLMDRTAGQPGWVVARPFPTFAANCILSASLWVGVNQFNPQGPELVPVSWVGGGNPSACELAYILNHDPVTDAPYVDLRTVQGPIAEGPLSQLSMHPGYIGWDPATAPNHGEGFYKDLSGNELPNAPHLTTTVTADYTLPLPNDWMMTLHSDFYYQSEAWTRIFNTPGYDKLKAYTNVNLAAILSNESAGWKVMAYVKNVFNHDSITGAFLNSDDTGLTTNVFLNEPRLFGLRITKEWTGGPWWTGADPNHVGPYPLTVELGGQVEQQQAPYATLASATAAQFPSSLNPANAQHRNLDWGDGREVKLVYRPENSSWSISGAFRYGANSGSTRLRQQHPAGPVLCSSLTTGPYGKWGREACDPNYVLVAYGTVWDFYSPFNLETGIDWSDATAVSREEHVVADFAVGRDVGLGGRTAKSTVNFGLQFADLKSKTDVTAHGVPDFQLPDAWGSHPSSLHEYEAQASAKREFRGFGPTLSVDLSKQLWGTQNSGYVDLDASLGGAVLFGRQTTNLQGFEQSGYWTGFYMSWPKLPRTLTQVERTEVGAVRSRSATSPALSIDLGLSYDIQRIKVSTGYRWERYFNAIDGGYQEHKSYDRTIDGPYFKIAVGFGG